MRFPSNLNDIEELVLDTSAPPTPLLRHVDNFVWPSDWPCLSRPSWIFSASPGRIHTSAGTVSPYCGKLFLTSYCATYLAFFSTLTLLKIQLRFFATLLLIVSLFLTLKHEVLDVRFPPPPKGTTESVLPGAFGLDPHWEFQLHPCSSKD